MAEQNLGFGVMYAMGLSHGVMAVQLLTPAAVDTERRRLNICLGLLKGLDVKYYALRSKVGAPLVLIIVRNNSVVFCRGANARRPGNYISSVVEFIVKQNWGIAADMAGTGLVRKNGKYYNIYDLPTGFVFDGNMDLSYAGFVKLPDMRTVTIKGDYNVSGNYLVTFYGCPKLICGNLYAYYNHPPKYVKNPPRNVTIGGQYYNVRPDLSR